MKVIVKSDTWFKLSPKSSAELSEAERVFGKRGTELEIQFYVDIGNNHLQIELANATLGNHRTKTWFVYQPDVEIKGSGVELEVVSDTLFKLKPVVSAELTDAEKVFVKRGTQLELASYLPAEGNHTRVALASQFLGPKNLNTWFAYNPDIKISGDKVDLKVISDTLFKAKPELSSQLTPEEKVFVKTGSVFELQSHAAAPNHHVKVALDGAFLGAQNLTTWYAYAPDITIEGNEPLNKPKDTQVANPKDPGKAIRLPGFSGVFYLNNPIIAGGNFTWGEATHGGTRIPANESVVYGIIRIAKHMEEIRKMFGDRPISINSWYRDPVTNRRVGGARFSRHLNGDAMDFNIQGYHPSSVYAKLNSWWGTKGGLASSSVFTHIDARGYRARWSYGY
ncbi:MAG TPA: D-Ala-D-Ala carboxypeptidase family metallohydrolase [Trichocoleus sp.]